MGRKVLVLMLVGMGFVTASMKYPIANVSARASFSTSQMKACKLLVQKMERSSSANNWHNRVRTIKCRDDLSPDSAETAAILRELKR